MKLFEFLIKSPGHGAFILFVVMAHHQLFAQGFTSSVGDRENIGIYGGPAADLSWAAANNRLFAAVQSPGTLFYSDDNSASWSPAFPFDSLEFDLETRGWGGGAFRVLTNNTGWVVAHTGVTIGSFSAAIVSYDLGYTFKTAVDRRIIQLLVSENKEVTAIGLSDHFIYVACENYLLRLNDTTPFGPGMIVLNLDTTPGIDPGSKIIWVSPSNNISGYPLFLVVQNPAGEKRLYKYFQGVLMELILPGTAPEVINVFTHPAQITGDTVFASSFDVTNQEILLFKSVTGGFFWSDITPSTGVDFPLKDADYSFDWLGQMPLSNGLRLSFPAGPVSDDLGITWQGPATGLLNYGVATHPDNIFTIVGSNNVGVAVSNTGISGSFIKTDNNGFSSANVWDIAEMTGIFYVATEAGLAYTSEYYNPNVPNFERWIPPNGFFPVPNAGNQEGVTAVAVDPLNVNHVICGSSGGFDVTFSGPNDFFNVLPTNWNNVHLDPCVTDIIFVNSNIVIAVTGFKHKSLNTIPPVPVGNIWRSNDGGVTWILVTPFSPNEYTMGNCLAMAINGTQTYLYSGTGHRISSTQFVPGALWGSVDIGMTWQKVNDAPDNGTGGPLPIFDIDIDPTDFQVMYFSSALVFARSGNSGLNYFFTDIPGNTGFFTSALIVPASPDSVYVTAGRHIYKYSFSLDDADLKFKGMPGEHFITSAFGSVLGGSNTGGGNIVDAPTYDLDLKVFIEGAFNGTDMNTTLNSLGYLPLEQPFNQSPWFYNGTETVPSIPNPDIVDWILVEIRITDGDSSTATTETRFERKAGFLLKNGSIVDDDGVTSLRFSAILASAKGSDKVHGVVYSPGQSGERTSSEMTTAKNTTFSYDFTSGPDQVYGGSHAHKEIAPGVWGMIAGDGDQDGTIDNEDKNDRWLPDLGNIGYFFSDFNRDGQVDLADKEDYWMPNAGTGSRIE